MTHEEVKALVEEMGLPYAYDHFAEGESPDPPFICFLYPKAENFGADKPCVSPLQPAGHRGVHRLQRTRIWKQLLKKSDFA